MTDIIVTDPNLENFEPDRLTQLYVNTKNIEALRQQLIIMNEQHQVTIDKLHHAHETILNMNREFQEFKTQFMFFKAMSMGNGPSPH